MGKGFVNNIARESVVVVLVVVVESSQDGDIKDVLVGREIHRGVLVLGGERCGMMLRKGFYGWWFFDLWLGLGLGMEICGWWMGERG